MSYLWWYQCKVLWVVIANGYIVHCREKEGKFQYCNLQVQSRNLHIDYSGPQTADVITRTSFWRNLRYILYIMNFNHFSQVPSQLV